MKKIPLFALAGLMLLALLSCDLNYLATSPYDMMRNICIKDQSYVGFLQLGNFEGMIENQNPFTVTNVRLRGTLYNRRYPATQLL